MPTPVMRAAQFDRYGPPEVLTVREVPRPVPEADEVLVRVHAVSVNPVDAKIRAGALKLLAGRRFPKGTGTDFAGVVVETGADVDAGLAGQSVWGAINPIRAGVTAEYIAVRADLCAPMPSNVDFAGAAALPVVGISALMALDAVGLEAGQRLSVIGASGGVGNAVTQLASSKGAKVTAVSSRGNLDFCREHGADEAYDYDAPGELGGKRFDAIVDVHGSGVNAHRARLRPGGRMATVAYQALPAALASAVLPGPRVRLVQMRPGRERLERLAEHVERGELRPVIGRFYALDEIAAAHRSTDSGHSRGKRVVLLVEPE